MTQVVLTMSLGLCRFGDHCVAEVFVYFLKLVFNLCRDIIITCPVLTLGTFVY